MNAESGKPRCWKTPVSRYWAKMTSEGWSAEQDPTAMPSSPAETWGGNQMDGSWAVWVGGGVLSRSSGVPGVGRRT